MYRKIIMSPMKLKHYIPLLTSISCILLMAWSAQASHYLYDSLSTRYAAYGAENSTLFTIMAQVQRSFFLDLLTALSVLLLLTMEFFCKNTVYRLRVQLLVLQLWILILMIVGYSLGLDAYILSSYEL